jgi:hydroxymethylpyrimidine/phosphomethylpyrimidine kinase
MSTPPVVWTIAGFDPSSGAGITADIRTIFSLGCYGAACITALTVQNTLGVLRVEPIARQTVSETLKVLLEDLPPSAIKIGMLANSSVADAVADFLEALVPPRCPIVVDPILHSSSGAALLDPDGVRILRTRLLPLATVVTPNCQEAATLTALPADDPEAMAQALRKLGAQAAVVTGGDATGQFSQDAFAYDVKGAELVEILTAPRVQSQSTHGTGCAFSTAIACGLARGESIAAAVTSAKGFVHRAIQCAPGIGHGHGPLGLERAARED